MFNPTIILLIVLHVGALVLGATGVWAYTTGLKWGGTSVSYYINSNLASSTRTAIKAGDATWDAAGSVFRFSYVSTSARNPNVWSPACDGYNDVGYYNNGKTGVMATTVGYGSPLIEIDTTFNDYYSWSTLGTLLAPFSFDVQDIMTHEFGHWLWLGDQTSTSSPYYCGSGSSRVTMCGGSYTGNTYRRSLAQDDKDGIIAIYGR